MHSASQASSGVSTKKEKGYGNKMDKDKNAAEGDNPLGVRIPPPDPKSLPDMIEAMVCMCVFFGFVNARSPEVGPKKLESVFVIIFIPISSQEKKRIIQTNKLRVFFLC